MVPIFDESEGLIFHVELWTADGHIESLLARSSGIAVARAALEAAIVEYPGRTVTLKKRTRLFDGTEVRQRRS